MVKEKKDYQKIKEELERTKEALEDLERYIEEFSNFLPVAICTLGPFWRIIDINQSFEELSKYDISEVLGKPIEYIFLEKEKIEKIKDEIKKSKKGQEEELTLISKEKKKIPVKISISSRKDEKGNTIGYFLAISDISEIKALQFGLEKRVEEKTKELKERLTELEKTRGALMNILEDVHEARIRAEVEKNKTFLIIENFSDGILVFDKENRVSLVNPRVEKFFGVKSQDLVGKTFSELSNSPSFAQLREILGLEIKEVFRKEFSPQANLTLEISSIPIMKEKERIGSLVIFHDITREKMVERMKTEFVSISAHQLRTPLSAIKWTLKMLLDGDLGELTKEQREFLEKTYISNERMIALINDLLNVSRIEEGRYIYKLEQCSLENLIDEVINYFREEIRRKKIKFNFRKPKKEIPKITADIEKMKLVLQNLFDNAIKYNVEGGEIEVELRKENQEIVFSIKDTGIGIPEDQQGRVFTKFFRAANALKKETGGSGLGLFITKNIIESHGGKIWFFSKEGEGSTFYFSLPIR